jgi:hypothetical protein
MPTRDAHPLAEPIHEIIAFVGQFGQRLLQKASVSRL